MHRSPVRHERLWLERVPVGVLSALGTLLLGVVAAMIVLIAIPNFFEIESSCVGASGVQRTAGDTYVGAFAVLGTLGWLGVLVASIVASIAERRDIAMLLPLLWFVTLVLAALGAAVFVGPEPCPP